MCLIVNVTCTANVNIFPKWGDEVCIGDGGRGARECLGEWRIEGLPKRHDSISVDLQCRERKEIEIKEEGRRWRKGGGGGREEVQEGRRCRKGGGGGREEVECWMIELSK